MATQAVAEIRLLGPVRVQRDGVDVAAGGRRQRTVLAVLALGAGHVVSDDALAEAVWGAAAVDRSRGTLQVYISNLRKLLATATGPVIERQEPGYRLVAGSVQLDVDRFDRALEAGASALRRGDHLAAAAALERALAEHRGPLVADLDDPAFEAPRGRAEQRRLGAVEDLFDVQLALGRHGELVGELERLVDEHPYRERLWGQLMLALYRSGRQADALAAYQRARGVLVDELGLEPGPELRAIERDILDHGPRAVAPDPSTPALHWVDEATAARRLELDPAASPLSIGRAPDQDVALPWDSRVSRHHASVVSGNPGWAVVDDGLSKNGTFVNGDRVRGPRRLADGDLVTVGATVIIVRLGSSRAGDPPDDLTTLTRGTHIGSGGPLP